MKAQIKYRGYIITWYPMEEKWHCGTEDYMPIGTFMNTSEQCKIYIDKLKT